MKCKILLPVILVFFYTQLFSQTDENVYWIQEDFSQFIDSNEKESVPDWTDETHGKSASPNYSVVFPSAKVQRLDIVITPENWTILQQNLTNLVGSANGGGMGGGMGNQPGGNMPEGELPEGNFPGGEQPGGGFPGDSIPGGNIPEGGFPGDSIGGNRPEGEIPEGNFPGGGEAPGGNQQGGSCNINVGIDLGNMDYVPASVFYEGKEWYHVGFRYKGNSSLSSVYQQANLDKYSIKLKFNEFDSEYPEISGQRFYGLKKINLSNSYSDQSFMRDRTAAYLFSEFGLIAAATSYYEVHVDYGEGSVYFGLFVAIEDIDDTAIKTQLGAMNGNLYKPEGEGASFADGLYNDEDMNKENNESAADYSDTQALYAAINNSSLYETNRSQWKNELEGIFDVQTFLKWYAVSTVILNFDIYGVMAHNYYIYNDNDGNTANGNYLKWIPWDHNEAFKNSNQGLALGNTSNACWPLIYYLMSDSDYLNQYKTYVKEFTQNHFTYEKMNALYTQYADLIRDSAIKEIDGYTFLSTNDKESSFNNAVNTMIEFVSSRVAAVNEYLK